MKDPEKVLRECKEVVEKNKNIIEKNYLLSKEEAIIIATYTYEDEIKDNSSYRIINKKLWNDMAQDQLTDNKSYFCLLLRALRKLPRTKPQTLYRGIRGDEHKYKVGEEIEWKGFSSTSTSLRVTQDFLKNDKIKKVEGTLFEIRNAWGYDLRELSFFSNEEGRT